MISEALVLFGYSAASVASAGLINGLVVDKKMVAKIPEGASLEEATEEVKKNRYKKHAVKALVNVGTASALGAATWGIENYFNIGSAATDTDSSDTTDTTETSSTDDIDAGDTFFSTIF